MSGAVCIAPVVLPGWGLRLSLLSGYSQDQKSGDIVSAPVYQYGHLGPAASGECTQHGMIEAANVGAFYSTVALHSDLYPTKFYDICWTTGW